MPQENCEYKTYLITGGVKSGKSSFALTLAKNAKNPFFVATGWAGDDEMSDRIKKHKKERSRIWTTIEEKLDLNAAIASAVIQNADFIIIDCLTLWTSNLIYSKKDINSYASTLIESLSSTKIPIVVVTNEVGLGIVPNSKDGREFRDVLGLVNQRLAKAVDKVIFMVSGIPMELK
jgi:adenosylcobinamide kinase/adenosylcobinamide-phosphate guanylyltransferase